MSEQPITMPQIHHDENVMPCCGHRQRMTLYTGVTDRGCCGGCGRTFEIRWDQPEAPPLRVLDVGRSGPPAPRQRTLFDLDGGR